MRAYSEDLRKKIVSAVERGMSKAQAARLFDVSLSSVSSVTREPLEEEGRLRAQKEPRTASQGKRKRPSSPGGGRKGATSRPHQPKTAFLGAPNGHSP